jgi:tetratricopeptide (TPR) repeat protein
MKPIGALTLCFGLGLLFVTTVVPATASERSEAYQQFRAHFDARRFQEAVPQAQKVVELTEKQYGALHPEMVNALTNLATTQFRLRDYAAAETAYLRAIKVVEANEGGFSRTILPPLLGLGITYQATGYHIEAAATLRRAVDVSRKLDGLFSPQQLNLLNPLIDSYVALARVDDAEREHKYAMHLAESLYGKNDVRLLPTIDRLARWYEATGRYALAIETHTRALEIVRKSAGETDLRLVGPLRGLARTYCQEFINGAEPLDAPGTPARELEIIGQTYAPPPTLPGAGVAGIRSRPRSSGEQALRLALKIIGDATTPELRAIRGDTLVDFGDWYQIGNDFESAVKRYRQAWQELSAPGGPGTAALEAPARLVFIAPPGSWRRRDGDPTGVTEYWVELDFTVTADGHVEDIKTIEADVAPSTEKSVVTSVRKSRYRPRFVDGEPVATPNQRHRQAIYIRKSGEDSKGA